MPCQKVTPTQMPTRRPVAIEAFWQADGQALCKLGLWRLVGPLLLTLATDEQKNFHRTVQRLISSIVQSRSSSFSRCILCAGWKEYHRRRSVQWVCRELRPVVILCPSYDGRRAAFAVMFGGLLSSITGRLVRQSIALWFGPAR